VLPAQVAVYGGFAGTEADRLERDPTVHPTILSGDLNGDDGPGFTNTSDNAHHVVQAFGRDSDATTILDGFIVSGGNAPTDGSGGFPENSGAGVLIDSASPTIQNCVFTANQAYSGAGIMVAGESKSVISRCRFIANSAVNHAAGVGMHAQTLGIHGLLTAELRDCVFLDNFGPKQGVAVTLTIGAVATISHCTFVDNYPGRTDSGIIAALSGTELSVEGCILRTTVGALDVAVLAASDASITVTNSAVQGGFDAVMVQDEAELTWGEGNIDTDPRLDADRTHLLSDSPCVERGDRQRDEAGLDIDGDPRVRHCRADMGADETDFFRDCNGNGEADACDLAVGTSPDVNFNDTPDECDPHQIIYVDDDTCPGVGSGTSLDPFCDIGTAINSIQNDGITIVEIVVADGVYVGPNNRNLDFAGRVMTLRSANGPQNCFVDAGNAGRGFHFHSGEDDRSVLDGFTVRRGEADAGGAILIEAASPTITNCVTTESFATDGGGIRIEQSGANPIIRDCLISDNEADRGGGISIEGADAQIISCTVRSNRATGSGVAEGGGIWGHQSDAMFTDSLIEANTAIARDTGQGRGGGVHLGAGTPKWLRCEILNNIAGGPGVITEAYDRQGGGAHFAGGVSLSTARLEDCTIAGNTARMGGGVCIMGSVPHFKRCDFAENVAMHATATTFGGGVYALNAKSSTFVDSIFRTNVSQNGDGGAVANINGDLRFDQCLFDGNVASRWGGAINSSSGLTFVYTLSLADCTIYGNTAGSGGGLRVFSAQPGAHILNLANSILWHNNASGTAEERQFFAQCDDECVHNVSHNCVEGWSGVFGGTGNIGDDPLFIDPNGMDGVPGTVDDDLHVHYGSPVIDAGDNGAVLSSITQDLDGNPRFADDPGAPDTGVGTPPIVDMGVFEGGVDCNGNGVSDVEDIANGTSPDCTGNGVPDECEVDCNGTGSADSCDIADGTSLDCNANKIPDECDLAADTSADCNDNGIPDECETDSDGDGAIDDCELCPTDPNKIEPGLCGCLVSDVDSDFDTVPDCLDRCFGFDDRVDGDGDTVPDGCDQCPGFDDTVDSDGDAVADGCDRCAGSDDSLDEDGDGVPDGCDMCSGFDDTLDCNENGVADGCDIRDEHSPDQDGNGVPDECCSVQNPVTDNPTGATHSRYLSMVPPESVLPGRLYAIGVTLVASDGFDGFHGAIRWVGPPASCLENAPGDPPPTFSAARLECAPFYGDWSNLGLVHVYGAEVMPGARYRIQTVRDDCVDPSDPVGSLTSAVELFTGKWGDVVAPFAFEGTSPQPDFNDVAAIVRKFTADPSAPSKVDAQLVPNTVLPGRPVDFKDIAADVAAFLGTPYHELAGITGPCTCPSSVVCGMAACTSDLQCPGGYCIDGLCTDSCGRCSP